MNYVRTEQTPLWFRSTDSVITRMTVETEFKREEEGGNVNKRGNLEKKSGDSGGE